MVVQIFRSNQADLPMNLYPGRAILFRNLKVSCTQRLAELNISLGSSMKRSKATFTLQLPLNLMDGHILIKPGR